MIFLHIDPSTKNTDLFNKYLSQGKQIFALFYMEGCGPCNATRPEWTKIENVMKNKNNDNIVIADVDQECLKDIKISSQPKGFPTMKYISKKDNIEEDYEDSSIPTKDRSVDSFVEWIENKSKTQNGGKKSRRKLIKHSTRKLKKTRKTRNIRGGKWSLKYKRSINCRHPKGFSQKQHCKYGRKHM